MSEKILVVDDEREIADLIEVYLQNENYKIYKCNTGQEALACVEREEMDLAILDIMLPDIGGFALCQRIREKHTYPIIMLTAKDEEIDKITGLSLGADDYITKPFRPLEMVARVKAQLRRYKKYNQNQSQKGDEEGVLVHAGLVMNVKTHTCLLHEKELVLTPTEFEILRVLMEKRGEVVSTETLFHKLWKDEYYSKAGNSITVHIRHLREKMNDTAEDPKYIRTVWGVGYKMET